MSARRRKKKATAFHHDVRSAPQSRAAVVEQLAAARPEPTGDDTLAVKQPGTPSNSRRYWIELVGAASTVALVVITAFYTVFAYQQVEETRKALTATERNFIRDERPYLMVYSASNVLKWPGLKGKTPQLLSTVYVANYGKSPAFKVSFQGRVVVTPNAVDAVERFFRDEIPSGIPSASVVAPGVPAKPELAPLWKTLASDVLTPARATELMGTNGEVFIVVRLRYEDFEGNKYVTDFCESHLVAGPNQNCTTHNELQ